MTRWSAALAVLVTFTGAGATAHAAPGAKEKREAQQLAQEAKKLAAKGELKDAARKYKRADQLAPSVTYKLEVGKLLADLGDYVQATTVLREAANATATGAADKRASATAVKLGGEVEAKTPKLELEMMEPEASKVTLLVDEEEVDPTSGAYAVNPGKHVIVARAAGYRDWSKEVRLDEGATKTIEIKMTRSAGGDDASGGGGAPRWSAYTAWGLGVVGLGVGAGFGVAAIQSTNDVLNVYGCKENICPPEAAADLDIARMNGNLSTVGFIVGGSGAVGGTLLFLLSDDEGKPPANGADSASARGLELRPLLGAGYVGVTGSF